MGRPSENPRYSVVCCRLSDVKSEQIRLLSQQLRLNRSQLLRKAYELYLAGMSHPTPLSANYTREVMA